MNNSLQNLFVPIPADKCDAFIARFVNPAEGATRDTKYDTKIAFLEKSQEIFTQGKLYGLNNADDVAAITKYVGTMPLKEDGTAYEDIVDYIKDSKEAAISGITIGANNSLNVNGTVYTLHVNNGEITFDPYTALAVGSLSLTDSSSKTLSNSNSEFDNPVSMTVANVVYTFTGTNNCKYLSIKLGDLWIVGTGSTQDKMESVNLAPNTSYTKELGEGQQVTISSSTGSDAVTLSVYAMDDKETSPVKKEITLSITHQRVYLVGHAQPSSDNFLTYDKRAVGNKPASITFTADTSNYGWFAYPASWGTPTMKDKDTGLGMTMAENDDWNLSDVYSDKITYKVYRTGQLCGKAQTILLTW